MTLLPLRGAASLQVEDALADAYAGFIRTAGRATTMHVFERLARQAGIAQHLDQHHEELLELAMDEGVLSSEVTQELEQIIAQATTNSLAQAEFGVKLASAVLLHAAFEVYLCALCRIGALYHRARLLEWVGNQQLPVRELVKATPDELADRAIESWLKKLERESVLDKWDRFVGLFGLPQNLTSDPWHFDRELLAAFDAARNNGVHGDGELLATHDVEKFHLQLSRATLAMLLHVTKGIGLKLNPARMFLGPEWWKYYRPSTSPAERNPKG